eukprot:COSAG02_NODE_1868_length_10593_cov_8.279648_6_plen_81_part_00
MQPQVGMGGTSPGAVTTDPLQDLRWRLQMSEQVRRKTVRPPDRQLLARSLACSPTRPPRQPASRQLTACVTLRRGCRTIG